MTVLVDDLFRLVADAAPTLAWISGPDSWRTHFNDAWLKFRGRTIDAELGHGWAEGIHAEDAEASLKACARALENREPFRIEYRLRRHDGEYRWMLDSGMPRRGVDGSVAGYVGSCIDVTDLKQAESAMRSANEQWQLAMTSGQSVGWDWDLSSDRDTWFGDLQTMFGLAATTRVASIDDFRRLVHPDDRERVARAVNDARRSRAEYAEEFRLQRQDGVVRWVAARGKFHYATDGTPERMLGIAVDITEQKHRDEVRRRQEIDLRETQRLAGVGSWRRDSASDRVVWSDELFRITGCPRKTSIGYQELAGLLTSQSWERLQRADEETLRSGAPYELDVEIVRADGAHRWLTVRGEAQRDARGRITGWCGTAHDITERRRIEQTLRENEERLRLAAQAGRMFAYTWDVATDTIVRSGESAEILGIDETTPLTGQQAVARIHPDDRDAVVAAVTALTPECPRLLVSYRIIRPDGSLVWVERTSRAYFDDQRNMIRVIGMVADITQRKLAEEALSMVSQRLIEAQEAERVRIARDLHDDLGQRLALLTMALDEAKRLPAGSSSKLRRSLDKLRTQAAEIATDMQALSHQLHSPKLQLLGVGAAMKSFCKELAEQQRVEIQFSHEGVPKAVPRDIALCLFRVLQEALHNAVRHSGSRQFKAHLRGTDDGIRLIVQDSGMGFDPRRAATGRGLGLSSMTERLKLVGGVLDIDSRKTHGTTLEARVPLRPSNRVR